MAKASIHLMNIDKKTYDDQASLTSSHINVGVGKDCTILELAKTIKEVVGFKGEINFDATKPDGASRKLLDCTRLTNLGFKSEISLSEGLVRTYKHFKNINENL